MTSKEENEKLIADNTRLKQENSEVITSINTSRLVLETAKKQEAEGRAILLELADEVEAINSTLTLVTKEAESTLSETVKLNAEKASLEATIDALTEEAKVVSALNKSNTDIEVDSLKSTIQVKQTELSELVSKINAVNFNLGALEKERAKITTAIGVASATYCKIDADCTVKQIKLDDLNEGIDTLAGELSSVQRNLNDTKISVEAYKDRKAGIIEDISKLNQDITNAQSKVEVINAEILELNTKRDEAEAEYKASESKIFGLVRREEALGEREAYAKERFKVAGLEY